MSRYSYTTQAQVRAAFWAYHPALLKRCGPRGRALPQNEQPADTRAAFVDFVDALEAGREISTELAQRATL